MQRLNATVTGTVQGVGFRYFVLKLAVDLDLRGWTANQADGSVRVVAEGSRTQLDVLLSGLNRGPRHSRVKQVATQWSEFLAEFDDFDIRR